MPKYPQIYLFFIHVAAIESDDEEGSSSGNIDSTSVDLGSPEDGNWAKSPSDVIPTSLSPASHQINNNEKLNNYPKVSQEPANTEELMILHDPPSGTIQAANDERERLTYLSTFTVFRQDLIPKNHPENNTKRIPSLTKSIKSF